MTPRTEAGSATLVPVATGTTGSMDAAWRRALALAWDAFVAGTTPVGAVVVDPAGAVVASGRGRRYEPAGPPGQLSGTHIAHAEVNALAQLAVDRHWEDHTLLTTLEPCGMCHGAAVQATLGEVRFAAADPYGGTAHVRFDTPQAARRPLRITGPLPDWRGTLGALLHIAWLLERPSAGHVVDAQRRLMPGLTSYAERVRAELATVARDGDLVAAGAIARAYPGTPG